ncbi:hypothetical protein DFLDMN_000729 [Cupriavidus sp. H19C3]|uniref:hypothetical protein n=1 Tax=Cupriavidus sp. H19C3 TaxID=3241603 RepID=UPI003BF80E6C
MSTIKTELAALLAEVQSVGPHVSDTGATQYGAALHQAEMVFAMAEQALSPPTEPTTEMMAAGVTAIANLPPDTTATVAVETIIRAALQAGQGA